MMANQFMREKLVIANRFTFLRKLTHQEQAESSFYIGGTLDSTSNFSPRNNAVDEITLSSRKLFPEVTFPTYWIT